VTDRVEDLLETFIAQRLSQNRSAAEMARLLHREVGKAWGGKSIHDVRKRDVVEVVTGIDQRGAPVAANKTLKVIKTFLRWIVLAASQTKERRADERPVDDLLSPAVDRLH
jgi:hypothetical protein